MITYPLNNIDYTAEDAELFHCTRTSGVWAKDSFKLSVTGANNNIVVGKGIAWINNKEFSGKVVALKSAKTVDLGIADSSYPRIDVVAIQFNVNNNSTDIVVKKGTPAANPVRPAIIRTGAVYELYLASIYRTAGATVVTAGNVTDLRMDGTVCGLMADSVTKIDTSAINSQILQFINELEAEINNIKGRTGLMQKSMYDPDNDGVISVAQGGTGKKRHTLNAVLTGNGNNEVNNIPTESGAFYSAGTNGAPRFGILPIKQGGTGANSPANARLALGLGSVATENVVPIAKGGTGATTAAGARSSLGLDTRIFTQHPLNGINIDNANGNWTVDISENGHGAIPTPWVNVTQTSGEHFIVQTAMKCDNSQSTGSRDQRIWVRDKYSQGGIWSNWREVLTEGRGAQIVKLWENTNLSGAFAGKTLSLSTDYDFFLISYSYMGAGSSGFVERTETIRVKPGNASLIAGKTHLREIIIKSGQLQFSDAVNDSAATDNKQTIPTAIYGIKGVQ